jgi:hypothetical protein
MRNTNRPKPSLAMRIINRHFVDFKLSGYRIYILVGLFSFDSTNGSLIRLCTDMDGEPILHWRNELDVILNTVHHNHSQEYHEYLADEMVFYPDASVILVSMPFIFDRNLIRDPFRKKG